MRLARILVATDFSEHSEVAARLGLALARNRGAAISLLHVDRTPESLGAGTESEPLVGVRPELWREVRASSRRQVDGALAAQVAELGRWGPGVAIATAVDYGEIAAVIERHARAWPADLIALGSHGAAANERYLFGSVLTQLLPTAPCPLLVTRASQRDRLPEDFVRPLVAVDYSRFAAPAAALARAASSPAATVELVHVWRPPILLEEEGGPALSEADRRDLDAAAELTLRRERERLDDFRRRVLGAAPARCEVVRGRVASALLDHARERGCDLIVVGAHGSQPAGEIGSVSDRVLRHATVPVLFLPRAAAALHPGPEPALLTARGASRRPGTPRFG
jgi:nucleotide-binding universal stress UspA family protein